MARKLRLRSGDGVSFVVQTPEGMLNTIDAVVCGVFRKGAPWHDNAFYVPLASAQALFDWPGDATQRASVLLGEGARRRRAGTRPGRRGRDRAPARSAARAGHAASGSRAFDQAGRFFFSIIQANQTALVVLSSFLFVGRRRGHRQLDAHERARAHPRDRHRARAGDAARAAWCRCSCWRALALGRAVGGGRRGGGGRGRPLLRRARHPHEHHDALLDGRRRPPVPGPGAAQRGTGGPAPSPCSRRCRRSTRPAWPAASSRARRSIMSSLLLAALLAAAPAGGARRHRHCCGAPRRPCWARPRPTRCA